MKVLLLNGSPHEKGCTNRALQEIVSILTKNAIESEIMYLGSAPISGCISCFSCKKTGKCFINDKVNELIDRLDTIDALVLGSPVYFSSACGQFISFLDRFFFAAGQKVSGKLGASIVSCRRGGATATFDELNKYFSIRSMPIVSSQYWNQVHGNTPEEVEKDLEGLQTMRTLGQNISWLLKSIEAGKKAGITFPENEQIISTNFIR
ncbi:MAG: flavodoxin family protein [Fusobacteriaceae bacterium]|jgi:multimeric flavodoxin WrbA|nr:flavodoxin family protein [Fusobacteriaceae bacterium]